MGKYFFTGTCKITLFSQYALCLGVCNNTYARELHVLRTLRLLKYNVHKMISEPVERLKMLSELLYLKWADLSEKNCPGAKRTNFCSSV